MYPYLARHNRLKNCSISVNQKIKIPRILIGGSETNGNESILQLIYRSFASLPVVDIIQIYYEENNGKKIDNLGNEKQVHLVIDTRNSLQHKIDIDLSDVKRAIEYDGNPLMDNILQNVEITSDTMKFKLDIK